MREIAILIARRGNSLIHLNHVNLFPRHFFPRKGAEHEPRRRPTADGEDEAAVSDNRITGRFGNHRGPSFGDRIGVGENLDLHENPCGTG